ncbi:hypothetical protein [Streptacidiphilus sp. PAMC 29251]
MDDAEAKWQLWLSGLSPTEQAAAEALRTQFDVLGATDALEWTRSDIEENHPQLARYVLLRSLWRDSIDSWGGREALEQVAAARRLLDAGADRDDLVRLARTVAYEAVFATVDQLDCGADGEASGTEAGWVVMESGENGAPTGRLLSGLHEDLLMMDPSGDGADLWE